MRKNLIPDTARTSAVPTQVDNPRLRVPEGLEAAFKVTRSGGILEGTQADIGYVSSKLLVLERRVHWDLQGAPLLRTVAGQQGFQNAAVRRKPFRTHLRTGRTLQQQV